MRGDRPRVPVRREADPDCSGTEGWFTSIAHVHLKNAGGHAADVNWKQL
jgi:hypothetical protein